MLKPLARIALMATLALAAACNKDSGTNGAGADASPVAAVQTSVKLTRQGDIAGLIEHMLPPADFARVKTEWSSRKDVAEPSDEDRQRFAEMVAKLNAPDAVEAIFKEIEPDITQFDAQYKQQIPTMVAMGRGYLQGLVQQSQDLSASEKEQANQVIQALSQWVEKTRFTDPVLVKRALVILVDTAREVDLKTLDEARALSFEQSAPKLQAAFNGLKKLLEVYDFSVDQTLDSVKPEVVSNTGDAAVLKLSYTLLGAPLQSTTEMVRIDGRWFGKDTIRKLRERETGSAVVAPAPAEG